MPKFENKFIHCVWDDELKGKKVFYADTISELREIVERNDQNHTDVIVDYYAEDYPFSFGSKSYFAFCYLDPNYELKVALEQGKTIQGFFRAMGEWCDLSDPSWVDTEMYRIKPEPEPEPEKEEEFNIETEITLFDKKYVHKVWIDELKGKKAFFADYEEDLEHFVEDNNQNFYGTVVHKFGEGRFPFQMENGEYYTFCYYDPYFELKTAFKQGKKIQALLPENIWVIIEDPSWIYPPDQYRIKPEELKELYLTRSETQSSLKAIKSQVAKYYEKPVTNRELAEWLARGNGEICMSDIRLSYHNYEEDDKPVTDMFVRKWGDVWHRPTREYLGLH